MFRSSLSRLFFGLALAVSFCAAAANAQTAPSTPSQGAGGGNTAPPPTSPGTPTTPGRPGQGQTPRIPTNPQERQPSFEDLEQARPIYLSGKVVLDSGEPAPPQVSIERVCNGVPKREGFTDSKGRFSFQLGQNNVLADASESSVGTSMRGLGGAPRGVGNLIGCELRASLPGYHSSVVQLSNRRALDNPDVGTIILERMAKVDGFTFSSTSSYAPKDAQKALKKGTDAMGKKKLDEAELSLRKAVELYPKYAEAWYQLGNVYLRQTKLEEARAAFHESLKADSKYINPYGLLARLAASERKWEEAAENSATLIKLNPYVSGEAYYVSSIAHYNLNKLDTAEEHTREALKLAKEGQGSPLLYQLLGAILSRKNDMAGAVESLRTALKLTPADSPNLDTVKKQLAELEQMLAGVEAGKSPSTNQ